MHTLMLPAVAAAWLPALADAAAKATVVLLAALLVTLLLRAASAATRHLVWSLGALLALPVLSLVVPAIPVPLPAFAGGLADRAGDAVLVGSPVEVHVPGDAHLAAGPVHASVHVEHGVAVDTVVVAPIVAVGGVGHAAPRLATGDVAPTADHVAADVASPAFGVAAWLGDAWSRLRTMPVPAWLAVAWAAGALLVLLRLVLGTIGIARVARRAVPVEDAAWILHAQRVGAELGIRRPVTLLLSDRRTVPVTWGVLYPVVLLPAEALRWDEERRRAVLLHELAHVERLDALTHVIVQLALALFWFHPLVWLAAARVREERERACDDLVLEHGTRPSRYADDLLTIARTLTIEGGPAFASLAMARPTELEGRLLAILDPARRRERVPGQRLLGGVLLGALLAAPLAAATPRDHVAPEGYDHALADVAVHADTIIVGVPVPPVPPVPPTPPVPPVPPAPPTPPVPAAAAAWASAPAAPTPPAPSAVPLSPFPPSAPLPPDAPEPPSVAAASGARGFRFGADDCELQPSGTSTSIHETDGPRTSRRTVRIADGSRCVQLRSVGQLDLAPDDTDLWPATEGGVLEIVERVRGSERRIEMRRVDGTVERRYLVNGRAQPASDAGAWLRELLPELLRESAFAAEPRVRRIRQQQGVGGVLAEVARIRSDGSKRLHLTALVEQGGLSADELRRVALLAGERIGSDGDQRLVLARVTEAGGGDARVAEGVLAASRAIESDGDLRLVLQEVVATTSLERAAVRDAFFRAVAGIESDGDRRLVLQSVVERRDLGGATLAAALESARAMRSDGEKRLVLVDAAERDAIRDPDARAAYERALGSIRSEGEARLARRAIQ